jgi:hypothetical protein
MDTSALKPLVLRMTRSAMSSKSMLSLGEHYDRQKASKHWDGAS